MATAELMGKATGNIFKKQMRLWTWAGPSPTQSLTALVTAPQPQVPLAFRPPHPARVMGQYENLLKQVHRMVSKDTCQQDVATQCCPGDLTAPLRHFDPAQKARR